MAPEKKSKGLSLSLGMLVASGVTFGTRCAGGVGGSGLSGPLGFFPGLLMMSFAI